MRTTFVGRSAERVGSRGPCDVLVRADVGALLHHEADVAELRADADSTSTDMPNLSAAAAGVKANRMVVTKAPTPIRMG